MQETSIREQIKRFIGHQFPLAKNVTDNDPLLGNGMVDSLGILEIVGFLEHQFQISIGDEELVPDHFQSIASLTAFVQKKQNGTKV